MCVCTTDYYKVTDNSSLMKLLEILVWVWGWEDIDWTDITADASVCLLPVLTADTVRPAVAGCQNHLVASLRTRRSDRPPSHHHNTLSTITICLRSLGAPSYPAGFSKFNSVQHVISTFINNDIRPKFPSFLYNSMVLAVNLI